MAETTYCHLWNARLRKHPATTAMASVAICGVVAHLLGYRPLELFDGLFTAAPWAGVVLIALVGVILGRAIDRRLRKSSRTDRQ